MVIILFNSYIFKNIFNMSYFLLVGCWFILYSYFLTGIKLFIIYYLTVLIVFTDVECFISYTIHIL